MTTPTSMTRLALVALFSLPGSAYAAGFAIAEQGAASLGVAGAATARSDLAETGFYNPAATPAGTVVALGAALIFPSLTHFDPESRNTTKSEPHSATPPYAHLGWVGQFDRHRIGLIASGYVPFGAALAWPPTWNGRFEVRSIELQVFEAAATAVYGIALSEDFEVGGSGSLRLLRSTVELERTVDAIDTEPEVMLGGDAQSMGGAVGLWARLGEAQGGVSYRSSSQMDFEGSAHFEGVPPELSGPAHDQGVTTSVALPKRLAFGAAWDPGWGAFSADLEYFQWSSFETFAIDFEDEETPDVDEPRNWHDTVAVRTGYEHRFLDRALAVRGGFAFDPTPSPTDTLSPTLPDSSRIVLTVGAGYRFDFGLRVDVAVANVTLLKTSATGDEVFPGTYSGGARIVSLGVGFQR